MAYGSEVRAAVSMWGPRYGVTIDPLLVEAVIRKESVNGRYSFTREPDGDLSYGPMMVKGSTARTELGVSDPTTLVNPMLGISAGVHYLAKQLQRFGGDALAAVSAYNAGPRGVGRNPSYVADVMAFYRQLKSTAIAAAPVGLALALGLSLWWLARHRRALAWRT